MVLPQQTRGDCLHSHSTAANAGVDGTTRIAAAVDDVGVADADFVVVVCQVSSVSEADENHGVVVTKPHSDRRDPS